MAKTSYYTVNGQIIGERTAGVRRNYGVDALGSVTSTIQGAAIENAYAYKPCGEVLQKTGTGVDPKFKWVGVKGYRVTLRDRSETYIRSRHFTSVAQRWLTRDLLWPAERPYAYVRGRLVSTIDPSGRCSIIDGLLDNFFDRTIPLSHNKCSPKMTYNTDPFATIKGCSFSELPADIQGLILSCINEHRDPYGDNEAILECLKGHITGVSLDYLWDLLKCILGSCLAHQDDPNCFKVDRCDEANDSTYECQECCYAQQMVDELKCVTEGLLTAPACKYKAQIDLRNCLRGCI